MNQIPFVRIPFQLRSYSHILPGTSAHCSRTEGAFMEVPSTVPGRQQGDRAAFTSSRRSLIMELT